MARVKERQDIKPEEFESGKASLRDELRQQRQNQFFGAYMAKAREKMKVTYSDDAFRAYGDAVARSREGQVGRFSELT